MKNLFSYVRNWLNKVFEEDRYSTQKNTIVVLDGVRGCAILFVIAFHINWTNQNYTHIWDWHKNPLASSVAIAGGTGVTLFFVLSGFLLFLPYTRALLFTGRWPLALSFYMRRALRIMPGYYLSLFLLIYFSAPQYFQPTNLRDLGLFLTFFMDSSKDTFRQIDGPYWTLAVEWQFYLILPILAFGLLLVVRKARLGRRLPIVTLCLVSLVVGGLFVRYWGLYFQSNSTTTFIVSRHTLNIILFFTFGSTGKYIEDFAIGMLGALFYTYSKSLTSDHRFVQTLQQSSLWLWRTGIGILVFSAIWHFQANGSTPAWSFLQPIMPYFSWLSEIVLAIGYGLCIMAVLWGPNELQHLFTWMPLRWIGLISYSLYIWHLPLIVLYQLRVQPYLPPLNRFLSYGLYWIWLAVVIVPFCLLYYAFVERPGMKLADQWRKKIETLHRARAEEKAMELQVSRQKKELLVLVGTKDEKLESNACDITSMKRN